MERIKKLIKRANEIKSKHKEVNKDILDFNIFTVIRKGHEEVELHSKIISELICNIDGFSDVFLELFLKNIGLDKEYFTSKPKVLREYKNIDILIRGREKDIIIENKIYAQDQKNQLERYYNEIKSGNKEIEVFYLTLDGKNPTSFSLGKSLRNEESKEKNKKKVRNISYKQNISSWIEECIEKVASVPSLREILSQYLKLINKLSGNIGVKKVKKEIAKIFLESSEQLKLGNTIIEAYKEAIVELKMKFWKELEIEVENNECLKNYKLSEEFRYNRNKVEKNKSYHGLMYSLFKIGNNHKLALSYEVCDNFYFAFNILSKEEFKAVAHWKGHNKTKDEIHEILLGKTNIDFEKEYADENYLAYAYYGKKMNFKNPCNDFMKLADDDFRKDYINSLVNETSKIVEELENSI